MVHFALLIHLGMATFVVRLLGFFHYVLSYKGQANLMTIILLIF